MDSTHQIDHSLLIDALGKGQPVITVNNRLARELQRQYDQYQAGAGKQVWPKADVVSWQNWLQQQYRKLLDLGLCEGLLLSASQERLLWEKVIQQSPVSNNLLKLSAAARTAGDALQLTKLWQLKPAELQAMASEETHFFLTWAKQFEHECRKNNWLTAAELTDIVGHAIKHASLNPANEIILAGFDEHPPARQQLLKNLQQQGCEIHNLQSTGNHTNAQRLQAIDLEHEMRIAATWAVERLQKNSDAKIALVAPALQEQRDLLDRIMTEICHPGSLLPGNNIDSKLFNISMGLPLSSYPVVADGLLALSLARGNHHLNDFGRLLRSPFLNASAQEQDARAVLDVRLRRNGVPEINRNELAYQASQAADDAAHYCPHLLESLQKLKTQLEELPGKDSPTRWAATFPRLLKAWGWPGFRSLSSDEYQQVERFDKLLLELGQLEHIHPLMTMNEALRQLGQLAEDTSFQPEATAAPIQVLGTLEASGLNFDHCWLLSMDDSHWPHTAAANPLLPISLQRQYDLPHASAERELSFAQTLTNRLLKSAPEVIASYASRDADQDLRPSPLIANLPMVDIAALVSDLAAPLTRRPVDQLTLDSYIDDVGPTAPMNIGGGSALIADQSACPFRAFARHRLLAHTLEEATYQIDPRLAGSIVHGILEQVWRELQTQQQLLQATPADLDKIVEKAVNNNLDDAQRRRRDLFTPRFVELEKDRLNTLIHDWLKLEKQREQPFEIETLERGELIEIEGLKLKVRVDRIDRLSDGRQVIIDYKTGRNAKPDGWQEKRLGEPQVPLYCSVSEAPIAAGIIAKVRNQDCRFLGMAEQDNIAPGVNKMDNWQELIQHWQSAITSLAEEVCSGLAQVSPKADACNFCEQKPLCRILDISHE